MLRRVWHSFKRDFATGVVVVVPLAITVWVVYTIWNWMDRPVVNFLNDLLNRIFKPVQSNGEPESVKYVSRGLGIVLMLAVLWLFGILARSFFGRQIVGLGERILNRLPFVRTIYGAVKQLLMAIFGDKKEKFAGAVLFEYPRKGTWAIGFVTSTARGEPQEVTKREVLNVFLPTTPNPTSGYLLMVPKEDIIPLKMSVEDAARLIISGGLAMPESRPALPPPHPMHEALTAAIPREPGEKPSADAAPKP